MLLLEERETIILMNLGDMNRGFISVWTTEAGVAKQIIKACGGAATVTRQVKGPTGNIEGTDIRVPLGCLKPVSTLFKKPLPGTSNQVLSSPVPPQKGGVLDPIEGGPIPTPTPAQDRGEK
jgi:hypothetical protein